MNAFRFTIRSRGALAAAALLATTGSARAANFFPTNVATLNAAISAANANGEPDVIDLGGLTYTFTASAGSTGFGQCGTPLIQPDGGNKLTIDGNGAIFDRSGVSVFRYITIANGSDVEIRDATFRNSNGGSSFPGGGAVYCNGGTLTMLDCKVHNCRAIMGGAVHIGPLGVATIERCAFYSNMTNGDEGGALVNEGQTTLANCTIHGNSSPGENGGGGIFSDGPAVLAIVNCTITSNAHNYMDFTPLGGGGGVRALGTVGVANSVLAQNTSNIQGNDGDGSFMSLGHNIVQDGIFAIGFMNGVNGDQVGVNPMLAALADNGGGTMTRAPLAGSPAIDNGDLMFIGAPNFVDPLVDQRGAGFPRRVGGASGPVDIGAYESELGVPVELSAFALE